MKKYWMPLFSQGTYYFHKNHVVSLWVECTWASSGFLQPGRTKKVALLGQQLQTRRGRGRGWC